MEHLEMDTSSLLKENNIMTLGDLGKLREKYSFPSGVQLRIPGEGEMILSTCPGEVAFYEAAFPIGLRSWIPRPLRSISPAVAWRCLPVAGRTLRWATRVSPVFTRGNLPCGSPSSCDSVEYLGAIRGDIRRIARKAFPDPPNLTLIRWLGGKVQDPFTNLFLRGSSSNSNSRLESLSDLGLSPKLRSDGIVLKTRHSFYFIRGLISVLSAAMSSRISLSTLTKKSEEKKAVTKDASSVATSQPFLKGIVIQEKQPREDVPDATAKKGRVHDSKDKEAMLPPPPKRTKSNKGESNAAMHTLTLRTSSPLLGNNLGFRASMMSSSPMARKVLSGVILPVDKEKVDQFTTDELVTTSFHALGQAAKIGAKLKDKSEAMARLEAEVAEITSNRRSRSGILTKLALAKKLAIEEFKSSDDFKGAVTDSAAIMEMDANFAEEEEEAKASKKEEDNEGEANPAP
ncbi:hypothetical protein Acr_07g0012720 [Actinidia rufa]|uniref:Uncharacterized protein n=1 Tax=Actinidia rufa TaxID=165716 RepID=A0A7J0EY18_9ERIC|nr:hypothetical protein Acr_07g0012720 [Actinidia rufa]